MRLRFTARTRLTLLFATLIAVSGTVVAGLVILLSAVPVNQTSTITPIAKQTVAAKPLAEQDALALKAQARQELRERLVLGAAVGIGALTVASAGIGWLLAGRVLRPVHTVSGTARRLSEQNLHERIPVSGPDDEMRELAETFNAMLARLQRSFDAQSHFAANAAHELRGPITTQRTLVEVAARDRDAAPGLLELAGALAPVMERQQRLVDGLLALAWSEHGMTTAEPVEVDELVRSALARSALGRSAQDELPGVDTDLRPMRVTGDPTLLDLMVDNLIRNAVVHNVPGGWIHIATAPGTLVVANTGVPITAERLATLTEPFRRGQRDRVSGSPGVGLGLAIVTAVARAHGAQLALAPRPGGGIRAVVTFPP